MLKTCYRLVTAALLLGCYLSSKTQAAELTPVKVGTFPQEIGHAYTTADGLPSYGVHAVAIVENGTVYAGTDAGLAQWEGSRWTTVANMPAVPIRNLRASGNQVLFVTPGGFYRWDGATTVDTLATWPEDSTQVNAIAAQAENYLLGTEQGLFRAVDGSLLGSIDLNALLGADKSVRGVAISPDGASVVVAASIGVCGAEGSGWYRLLPGDGVRSWALHNGRGVLFGKHFSENSDLCVAAFQGIAMSNEDGWTLFEGKDGLPYNDFTCMTEGPDGEIWFGTTKGAIRFDGESFAYREGLRWLPDNDVRDMAVAVNGDAWFATAKGVGRIERRPMTLAEKAKFYEDEIDKYNRRTPYGYVVWAPLGTPGDKSTATRRDDDNDGQWTAEYGAAECFAYAATKDPKARERATAAFEALRFLSQVTQGGSNPTPKGFPARTIWPTDSPRNPNEDTEYTVAYQEKKQQSEVLWKVIDPRWPTSEDGQWYWKCDTSSDELDGHYFLNACYFDLVAETEEEKARVAAVVRDMTDHLIDHNFKLVDHDGKPTRWAHYGPDTVNFDANFWPEHGLNSMSMLSYLRTAAHVTGEEKYNAVADDLIDNHGYAMNSMFPKYQKGPGSFVQFDDEMAFMNYYNLLAYETNPKAREMLALSWRDYWEIEVFERNPFYNFAFAARCTGATFTSPWGTRDLTPDQRAIDDSVETLKRYPLNLINWSQTNSHRLDILPLSPVVREGDEAEGKGYGLDGNVLPIDERFQHVWSDDSWQLDTDGTGNQLATGMPFLLGYYMGLYHGYIVE